MNASKLVGAGLFISYAWRSEGHREWVRLLAAQLKALGFDVLIDADVDYGNDLNGFMRRVDDSKRVLLVIDQNYVDRADTCRSWASARRTAGSPRSMRTTTLRTGDLQSSTFLTCSARTRAAAGVSHPSSTSVGESSSHPDGVYAGKRGKLPRRRS